MLKSRKEALIFVIDVKTFYLPFCSFFFYMIVFSKRMSAKAMPHHGYSFGPTIFIVSAGYQLHYLLGNDMNGNFHLHSIGYQPVYLSENFYERRHCR